MALLLNEKIKTDPLFVNLEIKLWKPKWAREKKQNKTKEKNKQTNRQKKSKH